MTHPGVGPLTGLVYVLVIGTPERFPCGKQIGSYIGLIPSEDSRAGHQRQGHISKQGNALLRYLLREAAQAAVRTDADWRRRLCTPGDVVLFVPLTSGSTTRSLPPRTQSAGSSGGNLRL
jgi:transposase